MTDESIPDEVRTLLERAPGTEWVEVLLPDINGVLRGKRIPVAELAKAFGAGLNIPAATVLLDTRGATFETIRYGTYDGDPDGYCPAVPGSLAPVPWARMPSAQVLLRMNRGVGEPYFADPRHVLERAAAPLLELGLRPVVAAELEFYLLDVDADTPTPATALIPGTKMRQGGAQYAVLEELGPIEPFLEELHEVCRAQSLPAGTAIAEFSPAQFEINLHHVDDFALACDHAVLLKRAIKNVAARHGFAACFMAKPFPGSAGSGLHMHISLLDDAGSNVFGAAKPGKGSPIPISDTLRHAIGGLAGTMGESMAVFAPNANSYRRFVPGFFAATEPNWGVNHRQLAIRLPLADAQNVRIEHRVASADANPYLVLAALLAGMHHGIANKADPGPMIEMGAKVTQQVTLPVRWEAALDAFDAGNVLPDYLGEEFARVFGICRRTECARFHAEVTDRDYAWYLRGA